METDEFSDWVSWSKKGSLNNTEYPGVYAIALCETDIADTPFHWSDAIIYIGMTNSKGGLKARLQQFENTIKGKEGHGGACRVRFKHPDYEKLCAHLYVSICPKYCNVLSNLPDDLRAMGDVAKFEYECFAQFVEKFRQLPEFNDKIRSPKK